MLRALNGMLDAYPLHTILSHGFNPVDVFSAVTAVNFVKYCLVSLHAPLSVLHICRVHPRGVHTPTVYTQET